MTCQWRVKSKISSCRRKEDSRIILNTLPISHYVEKVRWCLDKSGLKYEEEKDIGIFWVMITGRTVPNLKLPGKSISISNSSDILRYLYGHIKGQDEKKANFLEPTPESVQLEEKLDQLGSHLVHFFLSSLNWTKILISLYVQRTWLYFQFLVNCQNSDELALKTWVRIFAI